MAERSTRGRTARRALPAARRTTAADARLERLVHLLPAACRPGGASIAELAEELGVDQRTILGDLAELRERSFRLPPGSPDFSVGIAGGRVIAWSPYAFDRPLRLTSREALALDLALRTATLPPETTPRRSRDALRRKLERGLTRAAAVARADAAAGGTAAPDPPRTYAAPELEDDFHGVRRLLAHAARERTPCSIAYAKPGQPEVGWRTVHPYAVVHAEGEWYLLARCTQAAAVRTFRIDRIVESRTEAGSFERPAALDPLACFPEGRALETSAWTEATVRYAPAVARSVAETEVGAWGPDGSYVVRRPIADPEWLVRHVLAHAGDAVVLDPPELRALVGERARRLVRANPRGAADPVRPAQPESFTIVSPPPPPRGRPGSPAP